MLASSVFKRSRLLLLAYVAGTPASVPLLASLIWFDSFLYLWLHYCFAVVLAVTGIHATAFVATVAVVLPYSKSNPFYLSDYFDHIIILSASGIWDIYQPNYIKETIGLP